MRHDSQAGGHCFDCVQDRDYSKAFVNGANAGCTAAVYCMQASGLFVVQIRAQDLPCSTKLHAQPHAASVEVG